MADTPVDPEERSNQFSVQTSTEPGDNDSSIPDRTAKQADPTAYSVFSLRQKRFIACTASVSAIFSTLSSFIYYPALTALSQSLHVSIRSINLTVSCYFVVAAIAPSIMGDSADNMGRRPTSLVAFLLYFSANLGLALQHSYASLVVLRCLQSGGASGTVAIAYGIISDIAGPEERGSYVGILLGLANCAPCLGPVLGGVFTQKLSWRWIFWFLSIASGVQLLVLTLFLPETSRKLVHDGSLPVSNLIHRPVFRLASPLDATNPQCPAPANLSIRFPNPLRCIHTLFQKSSFILILIGSIQSLIFGCIAASLSTSFIQIYNLDYLKAGLAYLPSGVAGILAAYSTGKVLDYEYRRLKQAQRDAINADDLSQSSFPIEKARVRSTFIFLTISTIATVSYGWALQAKAQITAPLLILLFTGGSQAATFVACGTLITDLNPGHTASVQASYNLVRCIMNAAGIAVLQPIINAIGLGWCFTVYAAFGAFCLPLLVLLSHYGPRWRRGKGPVSSTPKAVEKQEQC